METTPQSPKKGHTRSRSATVLKSIISPSKRSSPRKQSHEKPSTENKEDSEECGGRVLGDIGNQNGKSPKRSIRTLKKQKPDITPWTEPDTPLSPAESLLLSPTHSFAPKDKENTTPPRTGMSEPFTPIWAEFTSQPLRDLHKPEEQDVYSPRGKQEREEQSPTRSPRKTSHTFQATVGRSVVTPGSSTDSSRPTSKHLRNKSSRILEAISTLDNEPQQWQQKEVEKRIEGRELEDAFESVLAARNVPENRRAQMRGLDSKIKRYFIKNDGRAGAFADNADAASSSNKSEADVKHPRSKRERDERPQNEYSVGGNDGRRTSVDEPGSPSKRRSRSRSRTFTFSKRDRSKKSRSQSRPRSLMSLRNLSSSSVNSIGMDGSADTKDRRGADPDEFAGFLKDARAPEKVEVGKLQKLRRLLRHESVSWVDDFIADGGMDAVVGLLRRIMKVEWREEHEDMLLREALLCLKGLCTTQRALRKLDEIQDPLFSELLKMLFDEERRGPAEYGTREIVTFVFFTHLSSANGSRLDERARVLLSYLVDPKTPEQDRPADFISKMSKPRPYRKWCKEVTNVTKEVFWIFLHHLNTVPVPPLDPSSLHEPFNIKHFPRERPPVPAAPYVGGVEWEATNYLASHLDLMNGLIASLPARSERNHVREELRASGFEEVMGGTLRLCKEKFYGAVHDGLRTWVDAAVEDGWETIDVRQGLPRSPQKSTTASPQKHKEPPPQLDWPLGIGQNRNGGGKASAVDHGWNL